MTRLMKTLLSALRRVSWYAVLIALVAVAGAYYVWGRGQSTYQTLVVEPRDFIEQVSVSGTVKAAQDVDLGFAQSGRIAGVYASVGDKVAAGKVLANIENGDLSAELATQQAKLQSLESGTRPEQLAVTQAQIQSDETALAQAQVALVNAIQSAYTTSDDAIHNKVDQFFSNPRSLNPTLAFNTANSQLKTQLESERFEMETTLTHWQQDTQGLTGSSDLGAAQSEAQQNIAAVNALLLDANAALNGAITNQSVTSSDVSAWEASVGTARANLNTALAAFTTAVTSLKSAQTALSKDQKSLALEQAGTLPSDVAAQQAAVDAARAQLQKTLVVAPFSGTITRMDAKVGEIVSPDAKDISMISNGTFQIDTYVPEVNVAVLSVGNMATVTLDAYGPGVAFSAKVIAIDPAETVRDGVATYKTTLQFSAADVRIRAGMTANVGITVAEHPQALVVPQGALITEGDAHYVEVLRDGKPVRTAVSVGQSATLGQVEITSGLSAGDSVVLNPQ